MWAKIDDAFPDHPKLGRLGRQAPLGGWLFVSGLCYCGRFLTDGFIPEGQVGKLADFHGFDTDAHELAKRLVDVGLWEYTEGGFLVHDYLEWNWSREKCEATRATNKARASKGGEALWKKRRDASEQGPEHASEQGPEHDTQQEPSMLAECPVLSPSPSPVYPVPEPVPADLTDRECVDAIMQKFPKADRREVSSIILNATLTEDGSRAVKEAVKRTVRRARATNPTRYLQQALTSVRRGE